MLALLERGGAVARHGIRPRDIPPRGSMDAGEDPNADPKHLIVDLNLSANNNNPRPSAGMTFLGQFLGHDVTFDTTSSLERQADPEHIANFRTPSLGSHNV